MDKHKFSIEACRKIAIFLQSPDIPRYSVAGVLSPEFVRELTRKTYFGNDLTGRTERDAITLFWTFYKEGTAGLESFVCDIIAPSVVGEK